MTPAEIQQLFGQTLIGEYDDEAPWDAVSKLRSNGNRDTFDIAADWLRADESLKRARAAAILAQLREHTDTPTDKPKWLFRDESFPLISSMLEREEDPLVLNSGVAALGHLDNPNGIPIVISYANYPDDDVRFSVACALGNYPNDSRSVSALLALTHDEDSEVRDWAVFGVGVLGDIDTLEIRDALFERLTDDDEDVREEAAVGLGKRKDLRLLPVLRNLLDGPELKVRIAEASSAMLGLDSDPEEWEAEDYKRALDEGYGPAHEASR